jgi:hypothetical protein
MQMEEEKWSAPGMTYFRPHFMAGMVPPTLGEMPTVRTYDPPITNGWPNAYDQALDLGQNQQNSIKQAQQAQRPPPQRPPPPQQPQQPPPPQPQQVIKREQVDQTRYGFEPQVNYSINSQPPPSAMKKKVEEEPTIKYGCDLCSYVATQRSSLSRHKMTQHEGIRPPPVKNGKTYDCELCPYQATQLTSLKRHTMAKHSGDQYPCDKCEYVGTTPNNLKLHKGSKHDGIRYPCDICGYQATQTGVLNKHKELKHGHERGTHHNSNMQHGNYVVPYRAPREDNQNMAKQTGFYHFSQVGRDKVKAAHPELTDLEVSKELSRRWNELDEVTRSMFEEVAEHGMNSYNRSGGQGGGGYRMVTHQGNQGHYRQKRRKKDPNAPKRSLCAFMFFSNAERQNVMAEHPNFGMGHRGEIVKELGRRWAVVSPEVRQKFTEMANVDKVRYEKEKHEWHMKQRENDLGNNYPAITHAPSDFGGSQVNSPQQNGHVTPSPAVTPSPQQMMSPQQVMSPQHNGHVDMTSPPPQHQQQEQLHLQQQEQQEQQYQQQQQHQQQQEHQISPPTNNHQASC